MSLFKVCNWWSAQCPDLEDNYDVASLLCSRFGLEKNEKDYIAVGSHNGYLSIFYPKPNSIDANEKFKRYQPTDLLLESQLKAPILGLLAGIFTGSLRKETTNQLAILHPNSLAIYNLMTVDGIAEHGSHSKLLLHVEHQFERMAFAFCKGNFGQVKSRDFLCIVHLDGTLRFYEQDGISYECHLPGSRPLPSSIVYCQRTDSFLRFNSSWELECFTYQELSQSAINKTNANVAWAICLGEGILDISVVQTKEDSSFVMVLGEKNLFCLSDVGQIEFLLKLDYSPKCFHSFVLGYYWEADARLMTTIISESSKLYIYESSKIIWAAQLDDTPIAVQRSNIEGLPGGIVTLGECGHLQVGYLGSDPFVFKVPSMNMSDLNLKTIHKELDQLEEDIKHAIEFEDIIYPQEDDDVRVKFHLDSIATISDEQFSDLTAELAVKDLPSCSGSLRFHTKIPLEEIQISFNVADGVRCSLGVVTFSAMPANTSQDLEMTFYVAELLHIYSAKVDAVVFLINKQGIPRVLYKHAFLPLEMFLRPVAPQKTSSNKLTFNITTKTMIPKICTFFPEFQNEDVETQALGLQLHTSTESQLEIVTIIVAKNTNRIRVQSDSLEAIPLVIERIFTVATKNLQNIQRNILKTSAEGKTVLNAAIDSINATPFFPIQDLAKRIDEHYTVQESVRKQTGKIDVHWEQFKSLQRSLLAKVDDEPMDDLVILIDKNYDDLIAEGDKLIELRKNERRERCKVSCGLSVAKIIISCWKIDENLADLANSALCLPSNDWLEMSWEESVCPGIDMLHYYPPLNSKKSLLANVNISQYSFEYDRFRRHFVDLFDRLCRIAATNEDDDPAEKQQNAIEKDLTNEQNADDSQQSDWVNSSNLTSTTNDFSQINYL